MCVVLSVNTQNELILLKNIFYLFLVFSVVRVSYFRCTIIGLFFSCRSCCCAVATQPHFSYSLSDKEASAHERMREAERRSGVNMFGHSFVMSTDELFTAHYHEKSERANECFSTSKHMYSLHSHTFGAVDVSKILTNDNNFRFPFY